MERERGARDVRDKYSTEYNPVDYNIEETKKEKKTSKKTEIEKKRKGRSRWIPACFLAPSGVTMCTSHAGLALLSFPGNRFQEKSMLAQKYPLFHNIQVRFS